MILVDTSVWVHHFRDRNPRLMACLEEGTVLTHPFVIGELACGDLRKRCELLTLLTALPASLLAEHGEVLDFVERHRLYRRGVGWIDAHLLASALLSKARLWTLDSRLAQLAAAFPPGAAAPK